MSFTERIQQVQRTTVSNALRSSKPDVAASDRVADFRTQVHEALFKRMGTRLFDATDEGQVQELVLAEIGNLMNAEESALSADERHQLAIDIGRDVMGLGPIEPLLADASVSEVMVNGSRDVFVERSGVIERTDVRFVSEAHLRQVIERIVSSVGRRIDESSPMVDARLADGSRVNVIVPPLSLDGAILTIRKFAVEPFRSDDLVALGTYTAPVDALLRTMVQGGLNMLISGGTGSGKTTLLNVMSGFVSPDERIVTIEDAVELQLAQEHVVRLEARPPNTEGVGEVTIRDLVRNALRMRPDRIIVGEVRGPEALDMLQAMNTGHDGSLSTVHANSPRDAIARVETMVLMAGYDLPSRAIREQVASALDVIIQLDRQRDGSRRVTHVTEVVGMEGEIVTLQDIFWYDPAEQRLVSTGLRPVFVDELANRGVDVPGEVFSTRNVWSI